MIKIEREMKTKTVVKDTRLIHREYQAALNGDGCITLRAYSPSDKDEDEIIIFSREETRAIFKLMNLLENLDRQKIPF